MLKIPPPKFSRSATAPGYPLSSKIFLIKSISCLSLFFVHIKSALCTGVAITFIFCFRWLKDSPADVLTTKSGLSDIHWSQKPILVLSTRMSKNGSLPSCSFSSVKLRAGCRRLRVTWKWLTFPSCLKMAKVSSTYRK